MRGRVTAVLLAAVAAWVPRARAGEVIRVGGAGSALAPFQRVGAAFERSHPGARVEVLPSVGTAGALAALASGAIDVGLAGRALEAGEASPGLEALELGRSPLVFAVGPETAATTITHDELVRVYRGEVTRWPDGRRIRLVLRPRSDADTALVRAISPALREAVDLALSREGMLVAATNQECHALLLRTPGALGVTSVAQLRAEGADLRALAWDGVAPDPARLADGRYPLAKPIWIVTRRDGRPVVRELAAFARSPLAREILDGLGVVPAPPPGKDAPR